MIALINFGNIFSSSSKFLVMKYVLLIGRILFSLLFIFASFANLLSGKADAYATSMGLPAANFLVPFAGFVALVGALMVLTGFKAKLGGWLIVIFLVPVTLIFHNFWSIADPQQKQEQMLHFVTNFSLIGAALIIAYFGSGPLSISNSTKA
ncbi:MAG TPA: DoxX family protein [Arachidicoccus sp.]